MNNVGNNKKSPKIEENEGTIEYLLEQYDLKEYVLKDIEEYMKDEVVKNLINKGYLEKNISQNDKRSIEITLTENGKKIVKDLQDYFNSLFYGIIERLGKEQIRLSKKVKKFSDFVGGLFLFLIFYLYLFLSV